MSGGDGRGDLLWALSRTGECLDWSLSLELELELELDLEGDLNVDLDVGLDLDCDLVRANDEVWAGVTDLVTEVDLDLVACCSSVLITTWRSSLSWASLSGSCPMGGWSTETSGSGCDIITALSILKASLTSSSLALSFL